MRPYERVSLIVAAVLSVTVHASAVVYFTQRGVQLSHAPPVKTLLISMSRAQPRPSSVAPATDPPPLPPQAPRVAPPRPLPALHTVPAADRTVRPVPTPSRPPPPATADPHALPPVDALPVAAAGSKSIAPHPLPDSADNTRETYLQQLLAHIDSHKFYPRSARRRGQEGEIQVSFELYEDGSIGSLQVRGGSRVLRDAAERAVLSARPMPAPPAAMKLREPVSFGMVFRLG